MGDIADHHAIHCSTPIEKMCHNHQLFEQNQQMCEVTDFLIKLVRGENSLVKYSTLNDEAKEHMLASTKEKGKVEKK